MGLHKTSFWDKICNQEEAIILLVGIRDISIPDSEKLLNVGNRLACMLPKSTFRSGNAPGSDEAFIEGVSQVANSNIELILPFSNHRSQNIPATSRTISLEDLTEDEISELKSIGKKAKAGYSILLDYYRPKSKKLFSTKASYLIRDILAVTGSPSNEFLPCSVGIFHLNPLKPRLGGTAFTILVAKYMGIKTYTQDDYLG